ncbi:Protein CBG12822 [Caenorhabditis briggsae]|uniref:L-Fucosyltransferase n=1 Tax=Caenorhabditis briggsae TaxID=6238 RepID=A8XFP7_CAEBR|nr:Protein CBG12822 [Caenorhabditis briggsae]CAP31743.2 Protein CBG12822 [Caenorhabditis briggsae]
MKTSVFHQSGNEASLENCPWPVAELENVITDVEALEDSGKKYIYSDLGYSHGLGNLMFQIAGLYSIAQESGAILLIPISTSLRRAFDFQTNFSDFIQFVDPQVTKRLSNDLEATKITMTVDEFLENVGISLTVRSARMIETNVANDDQAFEMPEEDAFAKTMIVGVHIRHGMDISMNSRNRKHGHVDTPIEYYRRAIQQISGIYDNVAFVICSDDVAWARRNLKLGKETAHFYCPGPREVDMAILSSCDSVIMSTGTFGWWSPT